MFQHVASSNGHRMWHSCLQKDFSRLFMMPHARICPPPSLLPLYRQGRCGMAYKGCQTEAILCPGLVENMYDSLLSTGNFLDALELQHKRRIILKLNLAPVRHSKDILSGLQYLPNCKQQFSWAHSHDHHCCQRHMTCSLIDCQ